MAILDLAPTPPAGADEDHRRPHLQRHGGNKQQDLVRRDEEEDEDAVNLSKGVRDLCERGAVTKLPSRYVLPPSQRPSPAGSLSPTTTTCPLPVIDLARLLKSEDRAAALAELDAACRDYGLFQVVNHGVEVRAVLDVARRFFDLPSEQRGRYASSDIRAPVRYGTSFNQRNDGVLCWRDFLKIVVARDLDDDDAAATSAWPDEPGDLRGVVAAYARATRWLFRELMDAALEALLGSSGSKETMMDGCECDDDAAGGSSSQMLVVNCYPPCPEPDLTLGMPPHSDYGLLTVLLQDQVKGLEVSHAGSWVLVDPLPGALVVNIGDHFEIFSNGRYKSVLHRVRVNSAQSRVSVASLHSLPPERAVAPAPELVDDDNPRRYMDTDFEAFLRYITSAEGNHKSFLQSRKIPLPHHQ